MTRTRCAAVVLFFALLGLAATTLMVGCIDSDSGTTTSRLNGPSPSNSTYLTAQGVPGDLWEWTINRGVTPIQWNAVNETVVPNPTFSGTAEQLTSGFLKLTVDNVTNSSVETGAVVYAMEFPGVGFITLTVGDTRRGGAGLAEVSGNPCPTNGSKYNWVNLSELASPAYAVTTVSGSGSGPFTLNHTFFNADGSDFEDPTGSDSGFTCNNSGVLTAPGSDVTIHTADTGLFMADAVFEGGGAIGGSIQEAVSTTDFLTDGRELRGVREAEFSGDDARAMWLRVSEGELIGGLYPSDSDIDDNIEGFPRFFFTLEADASQPGIVRCTVDDFDEEATYDCVMVVRKITAFNPAVTKYVIIGTMKSGFETQDTAFYMIEGGTAGIPGID